MITLGIDLSSMAKGTAACQIDWQAKKATASLPRLGCKDEELDELIHKSDVIGIDAPFGWPTKFAAAVKEWTSDHWNEDIRDELRFRETDCHIRNEFKLSPLSVSTDRIALPAMRAMALLRRHGVKDLSGDGKFFEVYPAGSLHVWKVRHETYKKNTPKAQKERRKILRKLQQKMPWLGIPDECAESDDGLDALIASLTARAAAQNLTHLPDPNQREPARREGWIHLPKDLPRPDGL